MCGFCGFTGKIDGGEHVIKNMAARIAHRGPDGEGYFSDDFITMGFRRLSFLDLDHGGQPMTSPSGRYTIVFNGEIYNFRDLQEEMAGHSFKTCSDTEVLLHLYELHGEGMLQRLRGMFAFVIYDNQEGEVFAARDFFGIKPFYYGLFNNNLLFASEIKAFLDHPHFVKELNHSALEHYLFYQYSAMDECFFKGVYKLPPAHFMRYKGGKLTVTRYWQGDFAPVKQPINNIVADIDDAIKESVRYHQVADVPIGAFLSSGAMSV